MENTLVTVLMPVYNGARFLRRAIDSILNQTYRNIELLIVNDGSTDDSLEIIKSYKDDRIRLIENDGNRGLIYTLNVGIDHAKGKYIARMDQDDISFENRIEKQVVFMEKNSTVGISGACIQNEKKFKVYSDPDLSSNDLKARLIFNNIFNHPTVIFRTGFLLENNIRYNEEYNNAEDYNLWLSAMSKTNYAILNEPVLFYENHENQMSHKNRISQQNCVLRSLKDFFRSVKLDLTEEEAEIHRKLYYQEYQFNRTFLKSVEEWLLKVSENAGLVKLAGSESVYKTLSVIWFEVCTSFSSNGINTYKTYRNSRLYRPEHLSSYYRLVFRLKNLKGLFRRRVE